MTEEPRAYPLVMQLMKRSRLQWRWIMVIVAVPLLLFLVLAAYRDGVFSDLSHWSLWRSLLDGPVLIMYILVVYPFIWRLWWQSVLSLQSLLPIDEGDSKRAEVEVPVANRRWELLAILIGAAFWLSLWQPWSESWRASVMWISAYDVVTQTMLFGLLGWLIYSSFTGNQYIRRLSRQPINLDIFDPGVLTPIARSSLGFSVAFIGGISLSLVFQTPEDLLLWSNITVWAILICFTVLLFFLSMWGTHSAMAKAKTRHLNLARKHLAGFSHELEDRVAQGQLVGMSDLSSTISALVTYEKRVKETPTWPFSVDIVRRLAMSVLMPAAVYLIKIIGTYWARFGF